MKYFLALLLIVFPSGASAAVTISEVAWMGSPDSPNHEWIELHNEGTEIDVSGWRLSDGNNLNILLSGTIDNGDYVVLERTSDDTVSGTAWLIYAGALVNSGATISLYNSNGLRIDQISGGENWENIGGNNESKDTAQRTSSGWVTAPGTPGAPNASRSAPQPESDSTESDTTVTQSSGTGSLAAARSAAAKSSAPRLVLELPDRTLALDVVAPNSGYVNQPVLFSIESAGLGPTWLNSLRFDWNFGDGKTANGESVSHQFTHPGTYVVSVYGHYKRHSAVTKREITILPMKLSLGRDDSGQLLFNNDSPYEVDISGYTIASGVETFTYPERSYISARQSIPVPIDTRNTRVSLTDNTNTIVRTEELTFAASPLPVSPSAPQRFSIPPTPVFNSPQPPVVNIPTTQPTVAANPVGAESSGAFGFATTPADTPIVTPVATTSAPVASTTSNVVATTTTTSSTVVLPVSGNEIDSSSNIQPAALSIASDSAPTSSRLRDWWLGALIILLVVSVFAVYSRPNNSQ